MIRQGIKDTFTAIGAGYLIAIYLCNGDLLLAAIVTGLILGAIICGIAGILFLVSRFLWGNRLIRHMALRYLP